MAKPSKGSEIIIKKVKKGHGGGHHGGSWKVAYADFVTAMMAFFLLMWLLNMTKPEQKVELSNYFKYFSLFKAGKTGETMSVVDVHSGMKPESEGGGTSQGQESGAMMGKEQPDPSKQTEEEPDEEQQEMAQQLKAEVQRRLSDIENQVIVDVFEGGVRIQIVDDQGKPMFLAGSKELTYNAKRALRVIADNIISMPNKISVEGHTDASKYSTAKYTNWELSTDRASSARKELENYGLDPSRLTRVAGYASTEPFIIDKPSDPRNRRISILVFNNKIMNPKIFDVKVK
jgi:chemotaxis protein MotB